MSAASGAERHKPVLRRAALEGLLFAPPITATVLLLQRDFDWVFAPLLLVLSFLAVVLRSWGQEMTRIRRDEAAADEQAREDIRGN
jgi:hypothetical protein